jgi:hypothetical protein
MFRGYWRKGADYNRRADSCAATLRATIDESLARQRESAAKHRPSAGEGTSTGVTAPDYFEPILGYRKWTVSDNYLYSPLKLHRRWEPMIARPATCALSDDFILAQSEFRRRGYSEVELAKIWENLQHKSPAVNCSCGYYAAKAVVNTMGCGSISAIGVVAQWGVLQQYTNGWRSQYAYPKEFYLTDFHYNKSYRSINKIGHQIEKNYGAIYLGYKRYATELWGTLPILGS